VTLKTGVLNIQLRHLRNNFHFKTEYKKKKISCIFFKQINVVLISKTFKYLTNFKLLNGGVQYVNKTNTLVAGLSNDKNIL